jgi:hypothetical protein
MPAAEMLRAANSPALSEHPVRPIPEDTPIENGPTEVRQWQPLDGVAHFRTGRGTGAGINRAYIERLNATFRASLAGLVRRGRALLRREERMRAGLYLVGCAYNFCWEHDSLRVGGPPGGGREWRGRTPAMASGLTDHVWSLGELLACREVPEEWKVPRKQRRRRRRAAGHAPQAAVA